MSASVVSSRYIIVARMAVAVFAASGAAAQPVSTQVLNRPLVRQQARQLQVNATATDLARMTRTLVDRSVTTADSSRLQAIRLTGDGSRFASLVANLRLDRSTVVPVAVADAPRRVPGATGASGEGARDSLGVAQLPGEVYEWPVEWVRADRAGRTRHVTLRFTATPLGYDGAARGFVGRIDFWAIDANDPGSRFELAVPIALQAIPDAGDVSPGDTVITRAHIPTTTLFVRDANPIDSIPVRVLATDSGDPHIVVLPVRPSVRVSVGDTTIQGWGVETADVLVELVGTSADIETVVSFIGESIESDSVTVTPNRPARAHLRTKGTGQVRVTAQSSAFGVQSFGLTLTFPFLFFGLAVGGSAVGASLGLLTREREPNGGSPARLWIAALIAGLVLGAAYFGLGINLIGVDLPAIPRFNEIAVAVVAALAASGWVYKDSLTRLLKKD